MAIKSISNKELSIKIQKNTNKPSDNNKSLRFDACHKIEQPVKAAYKNLKWLIDTANKREKDTLKVILFNLYKAYKMDSESGDKTVVAIGLSRDDYIGQSRYMLLHMSYTCIYNQIQSLKEKKYIDFHKGWYHFEEKYGKVSTIYPSKKLIALFDKYDNIIPKHIRYKYPVIIRSKVDKRILVAASNAKTFKRMCNRVDRINNNNQKHIFSFSNISLLTISRMIKREKTRKLLYFEDLSDLKVAFLYSRRFSKSSLKVGGRFYANLQYIKKSERKRLLIDYKKTVELDIQATFPTLLYAAEGVELKTDAYDIYEYDRKLVKLCFNCMLNNSAKHKAVQSILKALYKKGIDAEYNDIKNVCTAIESKHRDISHHFYTNAWTWLMFRESQVCEKVMLAFVKLQKPIFSIHDSFVVIESDEELLRETIEREFKKICGVCCILTKIGDKQ